VLRVGSERIADGEGARQLPDFPGPGRWGLVTADGGLL